MNQEELPLSPDILGRLINISGRQRMLSQRICFLLMQVSTGHSEYWPPLEQAVSLFEESQELLKEGGDGHPPAHCYAKVKEVLWGPERAADRVDRFIRRLSGVIDTLHHGEQPEQRVLDTLFADGTTDILHLLNQVTLAYQGEMDTLSEFYELQRQLEKYKVQELLLSLDAVSRKTKIIALNAQIVSARAGAAGKEFAVVATEIEILIQKNKQLIDSALALLGSDDDEPGKPDLPAAISGSLKT